MKRTREFLVCLATVVASVGCGAAAPEAEPSTTALQSAPSPSEMQKRLNDYGLEIETKRAELQAQQDRFDALEIEAARAAEGRPIKDRIAALKAQIVMLERSQDGLRERELAE